MSDADQRFATRAIRRKRLFLGLSIAGLVIAFALTILYGFLWWRNPAFPIAPRAVIVLLVLLNARQNLRQYKYARILTGFMGQGER
jgi:ABC-type transport system involved in cytochrome c biogenesis permease subunit